MPRPRRRSLPPPPIPRPEAPAHRVDDGGGGQHEAADGKGDPFRRARDDAHVISNHLLN